MQPHSSCASSACTYTGFCIPTRYIRQYAAMVSFYKHTHHGITDASVMHALISGLKASFLTNPPPPPTPSGPLCRVCLGHTALSFSCSVNWYASIHIRRPRRFAWAGILISKYLNVQLRNKYKLKIFGRPIIRMHAVSRASLYSAVS